MNHNKNCYFVNSQSQLEANKQLQFTIAGNTNMDNRNYAPWMRKAEQATVPFEGSPCSCLLVGPGHDFETKTVLENTSRTKTAKGFGVV